jgi:hypothetical protein
MAKEFEKVLWDRHTPMLRMLMPRPDSYGIIWVDKALHEVIILAKKAGLKPSSISAFSLITKTASANEKVMKFLELLKENGFVSARGTLLPSGIFRYKKGPALITFERSTRYSPSPFVNVNSIKSDDWKYLAQAVHIISKYLDSPANTGLSLKQRIWKCQEELVANGFEDNAKL